ncbi:MAG TPA: histidine kinase [Thermoanaerobacterales bacterium]|nr:histidine kinase [Thermoanaerobacterales bacterium]
MGDGLRDGKNDFVKYAKAYEEMFTEDVHTVSEEPPIQIKEGKHVVYLENESDGNGKKEPLVFDVTTSLVKGHDTNLGAIISYEDKNELERLRKNISRLESLTVMGELAASAVHEIKNPIFSIRGFLQLLESSLIQEDKRREYTKIMAIELDRLARLVDDFLSLTKEHRKKYDNIYIDKMLKDIMNLLKPQFDLKGILSHFKADEVNPVYIDADQLKQVYINIIQNAIDAMPSGGNIYINVYSGVNTVITEIKDDGIGIKKEDMSEIFKPFFTTKESGTGLGLYISRRIISSYGGIIKFESEEGRGTKFIIELPGVS